MHPPLQVQKRDGSIVAYDKERILAALSKCFAALNRTPALPIGELYNRVENVVAVKYGGTTPSVEQIQDVVEIVLQGAGEFDAAKAYILYRAEHTKQRGRPIPASVKAAFDASAQYFPTAIQQFQFFDKYSRFNYELGRRETWVETVDRSVGFLHELSGGRLPWATFERIRDAILTLRVMPSMRLLAMAGPAARRNHMSIYNCSYMPVDSLDSFVEALIISMAGCGVGYSVERAYVEELPRIKRQTTGGAIALHQIEDSAEGWAAALRIGLETWFDGGDVAFDFSQLRPAGSPLRTKGGRASGPEPLREMLGFVRGRILARQGSYLRPIDAHDVMCSIGNASISGGVRRTALIALFDYDDEEMRRCKAGDFERENSQRWNANNSAVWPRGGLTQYQLLDQMMEMFDGGRGEPGIFSREAAINLRPVRRAPDVFGVNPCAEINLKPRQFCNLSAAIARADDTLETLKEKVEIATIIGTIQSMATHFIGLRPEWRENCEAERLLGVDITGQMDCPAVQHAEAMEELRRVAIETNRVIAAQLGIAQSAAITCVKPSGNTSQLVGCASGLHARWAPYYVRNIRVSTHSPLFKVLRDVGAPMHPENGQTGEDAHTWVIHFPVKSPDGAVTRRDRSAVEQCEYWLLNKVSWTEHNPSCTISYTPDELIDVIAWVWEHRDQIGGLSFLPASDANYAQMPYEEITAEEYERLAAAFPVIDFSLIYRYEDHDLTNAAQELACSAGICEL